MKVEFYKSKKILEVVDYEIIQVKPKFHKKLVTSFHVNNEFNLSQRDKLIYNCEKCRKIVERVFAFNTLLLCKKCRSENYCLEKYGVSHHLQLQETKEKQKKTNLERYGVDCALRDKKKKEDGMMRKFGVKHSMQNSELREKSKQTCMNRYGVPYTLQSKEIQQKGVQTNLEKYGEKNPGRFGGVLNTKGMMEKYGVKNPFQSEVIKDKIKKTYMRKYGVDSPIKVPMILEKIVAHSIETKTKNGTFGKGGRCKWFDINGQRVQGKFEVKIAEFLTENNIKWIAHRGVPSIQYKDIESRNRHYNPDFYLPDLDVYLEPHAKYFWDEKFVYKIEQCKKLGHKIFSFDEDMSLSALLEHIGAI
jgi:hypothetical protein